MREFFTVPPTSGAKHEVVAAALDALVATTTNRKSTAAFLALVATDDGIPSTATLAERALWALMPESVDAVFAELIKPHPGKKLGTLARIQMRLSSVRSPRPIKFWESADAEQRRLAAVEWEASVAARRKR